MSQKTLAGCQTDDQAQRKILWTVTLICKPEACHYWTKRTTQTMQLLIKQVDKSLG